MAIGVENLFGELKSLIENAVTLPFGSDKCFIDKDKAIGLIEEIENNLPEEIRKSKSIVSQRNELLSRAKADAEATIRTAEDRQRRLVSEEEILIVAKKKASEVESRSRNKTREIQLATNDYVDDLLKRTEEAIQTSLNDLRKRRQEVRIQAKK